jgi:hypothetical protein
MYTLLYWKYGRNKKNSHPYGSNIVILKNGLKKQRFSWKFLNEDVLAALCLIHLFQFDLL